MWEILTQLVVLAIAFAVIAAILFAAFAPQYQFVIKLNGSVVRVTKGKVHGEFLDHIRDVCGEHGITSGWIGGVKRGKSIVLRFSRNILPGCQQRLRNIWFSV